MKPHRILIIEDDAHFVTLQKTLLIEAGYTVQTAAHPREAEAVIKQSRPDLILLDLTFGGSHLPGLRFLEEALVTRPMLHIIVISSHDQSALIIKALDLGAKDYIVKDDKVFDFLSFRVAQAFERITSEKQLRQSIEIHGGYIFGPGKILVGRSTAMLEVFDLIERVSKKKMNALILGESGTGKEVVADAIHSKKLTDAPLVSIDCGALPKSILESELFGVRENYPGMHNKEKLVGKLEASGEGTLLLDEIGNMNLDLQASLLRVLQEKTFSPLGSNDPLPLRSQVIASTNADLVRAVEAGAFRQDLFYRLNEVPIVLPPLRDRKEDIPLLTQHFIDRDVSQESRARTLLPETLQMLVAYDWPGNVRELGRVIQRAFLRSDAQYLTPKDFDLPEESSKSPQRHAAQDKIGSYKREIRAFEKSLIKSALVAANGNQTAAAKQLDISRQHLIRLMTKHGLKKCPLPGR